MRRLATFDAQPLTEGEQGQFGMAALPGKGLGISEAQRMISPRVTEREEVSDQWL